MVRPRALEIPRESTSRSAIIWQKHLYKATLKFTNGSKVVYNVNKGESREVWIFSPTASCWTTLWKTTCWLCQLASLAFGFPKLRPDKQRNISEENMKVDFNLRYNDFFMIFKVGCHTIGKFVSQLQYYHFKHICLVHMTFTFVPHFKLNSDWKQS